MLSYGGGANRVGRVKRALEPLTRSMSPDHQVALLDQSNSNRVVPPKRRDASRDRVCFTPFAHETRQSSRSDCGALHATVGSNSGMLVHMPSRISTLLWARTADAVNAAAALRGCVPHTASEPPK